MRIAALGSIGFLPRAPATAATLVCACAFRVLRPSLGGRALLTLAATLTGAVLAGPLVDEFGDDPQFIVIDEAAGVWLALLPVPSTTANCLAGSVLFRVLDKVKPGPIGRLEATGTGWSVMADDLLAGLVVAGVLLAGRLAGRRQES